MRQGTTTQKIQLHHLEGRQAVDHRQVAGGKQVAVGRLAAVGMQVGGMQVAGDKQVEEADNQQVAAAEPGHHPEQERQVKTGVYV